MPPTSGLVFSARTCHLTGSGPAFADTSLDPVSRSRAAVADRFGAADGGSRMAPGIRVPSGGRLGSPAGSGWPEPDGPAGAGGPVWDTECALPPGGRGQAAATLQISIVGRAARLLYLLAVTLAPPALPGSPGPAAAWSRSAPASCETRPGIDALGLKDDQEPTAGKADMAPLPDSLSAPAEPVN
jgi:hypothetical protein